MDRYIDAFLLKDYINSRGQWLAEWETIGILVAIDKQPTADVRPERHGKWVYHHDIHGISYSCSNCTCGVSDTGTDNYCHYCGAKMDGDTDG